MFVIWKTLVFPFSVVALNGAPSFQLRDTRIGLHGQTLWFAMSNATSLLKNWSNRNQRRVRSRNKKPLSSDVLCTLYTAVYQYGKKPKGFHLFDETITTTTITVTVIITIIYKNRWAMRFKMNRIDFYFETRCRTDLVGRGACCFWHIFVFFCSLCFAAFLCFLMIFVEKIVFLRCFSSGCFSRLPNQRRSSTILQKSALNFSWSVISY